MSNIYNQLGHEKYCELCKDLAELYIISDMAEMMIPTSEGKIRAKSYRDADYNTNNGDWQKFQNISRYMSEAIDGLEKLGYKIIKTP